MADADEAKKKASKAAIVKKAFVVAFGVFFFGVGLFILIVVILAKLASKGTPTT